MIFADAHDQAPVQVLRTSILSDALDLTGVNRYAVFLFFFSLSVHHAVPQLSILSVDVLRLLCRHCNRTLLRILHAASRTAFLKTG